MRVEVLSAEQAAEVSRLVAAVETADGVAPASEQTRLAIRDRQPGPALLVEREGTVVGYAHLTPGGTETSVELLVHPAWRRRGIGRWLAEAAQAMAGAAGRYWAHGDLPAATGLASAMGWHRGRELWQLRRSLSDPVPDPALPASITVRPFRVGRDEDAWLAVNARAFADHPEQGRWTIDDLTAREQEPWFDAAGFFLAEEAGRLLGFHWTKIHPSLASCDGTYVPHPHQAAKAAKQPAGCSETYVPSHEAGAEGVGEIYVLGVDPAASGHGLGRALALVGLRHLRDAGLEHAMLYVEHDNAPAVRLYESLGFERWSTDVMYQA